jgi:hypothetical protein
VTVEFALGAKASMRKPATAFDGNSFCHTTPQRLRTTAGS